MKTLKVKSGSNWLSIYNDKLEITEFYKEIEVPDDFNTEYTEVTNKVKTDTEKTEKERREFLFSFPQKKNN